MQTFPQPAAHVKGHFPPRGTNDILRAVSSIEEGEEAPLAKSTLLSQVVMPALSQAESAFSAALHHINVKDLVGTAELIKKPAD